MEPAKLAKKVSDNGVTVAVEIPAQILTSKADIKAFRKSVTAALDKISAILD